MVVGNLVLANVAVVFIFLTVITGFLLYTMNFYHKEEYEIHKNRMILFFIFEGSVIALQVHYATIKHDSGFSNDVEQLVLYLAVGGLPVVLQMIGLVFIKSTKDPIQGISKLDCLEIVSIN